MEIQRNEKIKELATLALLQDLWLTFYENVKLSDKGDVQTVDEVAQKRVQLIMQYIHENYNRNLSLDEIASHIGISKSTADRKSTRLNSSHNRESRMPSSA